MKLRTLMNTQFVNFYVCDENGTHREVSHRECFAYPILPDQRWYFRFDEKDPKNASNIIVRMPTTDHGKKIGNRSEADIKADDYTEEAMAEFDFISTDKLLGVSEDGKTALCPEALIDRINTPENICILREDKQEFWAEVTSLLPSDYPQLAFDIFVEKLPGRELAKKYNCSEGTIRNRKKQIKELLEASAVLKALWKQS